MSVASHLILPSSRGLFRAQCVGEEMLEVRLEISYEIYDSLAVLQAKASSIPGRRSDETGDYDLAAVLHLLSPC